MCRQRLELTLISPLGNLMLPSLALPDERKQKQFQYFLESSCARSRGEKFATTEQAGHPVRHANSAALVARCGPGSALSAGCLLRPPANSPRPRPRIGVALGGGGALGLAHIGVLKWLEDHRIPVDYIAGTSMGGLIGGVYATGMRPPEINDLVSNIDWNEVLSGQGLFSDLTYRRKEDLRAYPNSLQFGLRHGLTVPGGLNAGQSITFLFDRIALPYSLLKSFDDLPIPFRCVGTDLITGQPHVFKEGPLGQALRSTMSLPAVFTPVNNGTTVYADGGLLDNLPVDVVKAMGADIVIAVVLNSTKFDTGSSQSMFSIMGRSISVMISANELRSMQMADLVLSVDLSGYTSADYGAAAEALFREDTRRPNKSRSCFQGSLWTRVPGMTILRNVTPSEFIHRRRRNSWT